VRSAFIRALLQVARQDPRVLLVTGDLGFAVLDEFRATCPRQFYNVGVAEQNLAGVAAGLALSGHTVFTYSIGNFPTLRCLEQIRNDICYHNADVKVVTVGGGLAYGALGVSHFATEDLAILRSLPQMTVVAPGDPVEVEQLVPQIVARRGPVYLRLGRAGEKPVHDPGVDVVLGRPTEARPGSDVLLLTVGGMLPVALEAAALLDGDGLDAEVVSVHTLKPLDADRICALAARFPLVVTCEEHSAHGGLGGAVAEVLLEAGIAPAFRRFALPAGFPKGVGSQEYLRTANGLDAHALRELVRSLAVARGARIPMRREEEGLSLHQ
jgi:transketolase